MYKRQAFEEDLEVRGVRIGSHRILRATSPAIPNAIAATPVSYTHLRAHETVLDLVCRLLLEQKKKKYTQHLF